MRWGDQRQTYDLKSSTKAIGVTAVGLALMDGKFQSLHDPASKYHPGFGVPPEANRDKNRLHQIRLFHLVSQTAGFDKPGGYTELLFEPGAKWSYSDGGPNWLAECVTLVYGRDMQELIVVARSGKSLSTSRDPHYAPIQPFLTPIAVSVKDRGRWPGAPYPPSDFIQGIHWAPPESITRKADGSRSRA